MNPKKIKIINSGTIEVAEILYELDPATLTVNFSDHASIKSSGSSLFECFSQIRLSLPNIVFLCEGAKRNVYPSRMSSQMASGLLAYEFKLGEQALKKDIVNIFDHDEIDVVEDPNDQAKFYRIWLESLK
jgi:hypothetical protein